MANGNKIVREIGAATSDAASLYAEGLQMCQATRNILLNPENPTAYANHNAAVKNFERLMRSLDSQVRTLFPGAGVDKALSTIDSSFRTHLEVQHRIHDLARRHDFDLGKQLLNSRDTPLWRKYKDQILSFQNRWRQSLPVLPMALNAIAGWRRCFPGVPESRS